MNPPEPNRWRMTAREFAVVATAFVASRFLVFGTIYLSRLEIIRGAFWQPGNWLDVLTHGDGGAYLALARNLSSIGSAELDPTISFFPVYPLLVAIVSFVIHDAAVAAVLVSNLSLLGAGCGLYRLTQLEFRDERISRASVTFLMFAPGALFFSTGTAESTFLLLAMASLLAARQGRWVAASICGALAAATMNLGFLLMIPLAVELLSQVRNSAALPPFRWRNALLLAAIPALLIVALLAGSARFGDPIASLRLGADSRAAFGGLVNLSSAFAPSWAFWEWLFGLTMCAAAVVCALAAFTVRLRASYVSFAVALLAACAVSHDVEALRTLALALPLAMTLAALTRKLDWMYEPLLLVSAGLLALVAVLFANGHWIT